MTEGIRIDQAVSHAAKQLDSVSESPRLDAELLLCRVLDVSRSYLIAHPEDQLDDAAAARFENVLTRRRNGEPMAYIAGTREFWSLELMVTPATLIPRPDTETLVQQALLHLPGDSTARVADLGTGSGAVALAIAHERPLCTVVATDISADALKVARQNARQLDIGNVEFIEGNWTEPLNGQLFDLVVSNPPYVDAADPALQTLQFEPRDALVADDHGLAAIRAISASAAAIIDGDARLCLEHGADQQSAVTDILANDGWTDIACVTDLAGLPRVTSARQSPDGP